MSVPRGKTLTPPPLLAELPADGAVVDRCFPERPHAPAGSIEIAACERHLVQGQVATAGDPHDAEIGGCTAVPFDRAVVALDGNVAGDVRQGAVCPIGSRVAVCVAGQRIVSGPDGSPIAVAIGLAVVVSLAL